MENKGQIFAYDSEKARLAPIFDRLKRAESRNVQVVTKPHELGPLEGRMDLVLVDAPCTGSGTWRRRPDAKWRLTDRQLSVRTGEQARILDAAKAYVKPGGRLVYITCSVFLAENAGQIDAFLAREPGFGPLDHEDLWNERVPGHPAAARVDKMRGISLTPARSGTDGFYVAALRKEA
jgi:16S rRNA (cytosine967-C5)-methyltransferase